MSSSTRPPGRFGRSINNKSLDSVFSSPTLNAAAGSVWISPETFDVVSIRATLKGGYATHFVTDLETARALLKG